MENKNESITRQEEDFAQWYTDVCRIIYRPYGYAIWEQIQNYLDKKFKGVGVENVYMPLVIPESLFNKEKEHVEGFAPECLIATVGGQAKLEDRLCDPFGQCFFRGRKAGQRINLDPAGRQLYFLFHGRSGQCGSERIYPVYRRCCRNKVNDLISQAMYPCTSPEMSYRE